MINNSQLRDAQGNSGLRMRKGLFPQGDPEAMKVEVIALWPRSGMNREGRVGAGREEPSGRKRPLPLQEPTLDWLPLHSCS